MKNVEVMAKFKENDVQNQDALKFKEETQNRKENLRARNLNHVAQVLEQMKEEPRTFAKTGIAILQ